MTRYQTAVLENGLRIIALSTTSPVVYCGYQLNVGTANELPDEEGIAHFCEHVTFKNLFMGVFKTNSFRINLWFLHRQRERRSRPYSIKLSISSRRSSATCRPVRYRDNRASPDFSLTLTSTGSGGSSTSTLPSSSSSKSCLR